MTPDYIEPQFGPNEYSSGLVSWVCGDCGRGNGQKRPTTKNGEDVYRCHKCGAPVEVEQEVSVE